MSAVNNKIIPPPPVPSLDIQIEIMKRLPVKSLLKFRSVSQQWKSIINSPTFISDYSKNSTHHMLLVAYFEQFLYILEDDDDCLPKSHEFCFYGKFPSICDISQIIGCSKGLFAYVSDKFVVICNPSIRKSVIIPLPNNISKWPNDPVFGFGVVSYNNANVEDPVIVNINYTNTKTIGSIQVFNLSTRAWRTLSNTSNCLPRNSLLFKTTSLVSNDAVVIDMFIYWHAFDRDHNLNLLLSFNMISEDFSEIRLPDSLAHNSSNNCRTFKLRESLVVIEPKSVEGKREFDVWMMEEHISAQNSFKKLYAIKSPSASIGHVLGFRNSGQSIVEGTLDQQSTSIFVYDPDNQQLDDSGIPADCGYANFASSYKSTLLLLNHCDLDKGNRKRSEETTLGAVKKLIYRVTCDAYRLMLCEEYNIYDTIFLAGIICVFWFYRKG